MRPRAALTAALALLLTGCGVMKPPKPWEKEDLARPEMTMAGDALDQRFTQHVYQSKENGTGSSAVGGGGCGCN